MRQAGACKDKGRVLYVGQSFYHAWYLSRELRKLGWKADVLNWDPIEPHQMLYHGEDFRFYYRGLSDLLRHLRFFAKSLREYDIFHFSNAHNMRFGNYVHFLFKRFFGEYSEVKLLKEVGKKIVYSTNGCLDGASQTSFGKWGPDSTCDICRWKNVPTVCSDERNMAWGKIRNSLADYIVTFDHSPTDYNLAPHVHTVPEFYCLDPNVWSPDLVIPANYRLPFPENTAKLYHSVRDFELRTSTAENQNIKCTHIYFPLVERLKREGHKIELMFFHDVPNKKLRYYQAQADIVVDMLTFGWFGANIREAMMLGKPAVCYMRPEWLEIARKEIPEYVRELPVVSATPQTAYDIIRDLVENPQKRMEIGSRSREFAIKWHSAEAGARKFDKIYSDLLNRE